MHYKFMAEIEYDNSVNNLSKKTLSHLRKEQQLIQEQLNQIQLMYNKKKTQLIEHTLFRLIVIREMRIDAIDKLCFNKKGYCGNRITELKTQYNYL